MTELLPIAERCLGIGQPAKAIEPEPEIKPQTLPERLVDLRQELEANAAILLDERGRVVAQAGNLAEGEPEDGLIPALMAVSSAGGRVSHLLGNHTPDSLMFFTGESQDLFLAPVGQTLALLVATPASRDDRRVGAVLRVVRPAIQDFLGIIKRLSLPAPEVPTAAPSVPPVEPESVAVEEIDAAEVLEMESLIDQAAGQPSPADVDAFWDRAVEQESPETAAGVDALSYAQARQLGLAPEDEPGE
jgi:hypothetical protein